MLPGITSDLLLHPVLGFFAAVTVPWPLVALLVAVTGVGVWAAMVWMRMRASRRRLETRAATWRRRNRALEGILSVTARINATRNLAELEKKIAVAVAEVSGFKKVVVYLWSDTAKAFEACAFTGLSAADQAELAGDPILPSDYDDLKKEEYRYANCYLVDPAGERGRETASCRDLLPDSRRWKPGQRLIAPLASASGEVIGFLDLDLSLIHISEPTRLC